MTVEPYVLLALVALCLVLLALAVALKVQRDRADARARFYWRHYSAAAMALVFSKPPAQARPTPRPPAEGGDHCRLCEHVREVERVYCSGCHRFAWRPAQGQPGGGRGSDSGGSSG